MFLAFLIDVVLVLPNFVFYSFVSYKLAQAQSMLMFPLILIIKLSHNWAAIHGEYPRPPEPSK